MVQSGDGFSMMVIVDSVTCEHRDGGHGMLSKAECVPETVAGALLHGDGNGGGGGGGGQRRQQRRCKLVAGRVGIAIAHALRGRYPSATILAKPLLHAPKASCD